MRKPTLVALSLTAVLLVAFQNCGKLGFSLAQNSKTNASLSLGVDQPPSLTVTGDVPVKIGALATLTVLTKNATSKVTYTCARLDDATAVVGEGALELFDGIGVLPIQVDHALSCTFVVHADERTAQTIFEIPTEPAIGL